MLILYFLLSFFFSFCISNNFILLLLFTKKLNVLFSFFLHFTGFLWFIFFYKINCAHSLAFIIIIRSFFQSHHNQKEKSTIPLILRHLREFVHFPFLFLIIMPIMFCCAIFFCIEKQQQQQKENSSRSKERH